MIFDGPVLYMKVPFLTESLPDPRPWIKIDLDLAAEQGRTDLAQISQLGQGDPTQMLELLRGLNSNVRDVGTQDLHGVKTTHYEMVLDLGRVAKDASSQARSGVESLIARGSTDKLPADIWIDAQGRMRKMTYDVSFPGTGDPAQDARDALSVTMELYRFGIAVDVRPPPDDQVVDLLELSSAQQGSS